MTLPVAQIEAAILEKAPVFADLRQQVTRRYAVRDGPGRIEDEIPDVVAEYRRSARGAPDLGARLPDNLPVRHDVNPKTRDIDEHETL